eukprot:SAG31_NODE_359_length_17032_cov_11.017894_7_plen_182_part_00
MYTELGARCLDYDPIVTADLSYSKCVSNETTGYTALRLHVSLLGSYATYTTAVQYRSLHGRKSARCCCSSVGSAAAGSTPGRKPRFVQFCKKVPGTSIGYLTLGDSHHWNIRLLRMLHPTPRARWTIASRRGHPKLPPPFDPAAIRNFLAEVGGCSSSCARRVRECHQQVLVPVGVRKYRG